MKCLLVVLSSLCFLFGAPLLGQVTVVGCDGGTDHDDQWFDPVRSIGNPGDKIANWHIGFPDQGRYSIPFNSPHPFQMFAYRMNQTTSQWVALPASG